MIETKKLIFVLIITILFFRHSPAQDINEINFTGKISDNNGNLVGGAKVTVYEMHSDGVAGNIFLYQAGEMITTDDGKFLITVPLYTEGTLINGYIVAHKDGLALGWALLDMKDDLEANIELVQAQTIQGFITNQTGDPIVGAKVCACLYRIETNDQGRVRKVWLPGIDPLEELITKTNDEGEFFFNNLSADLGVDLLITADGMATTYTYSNQSQEPYFKTGQTGIKIALTSQGRITGKILTPETNQAIARRKFAVVSMESSVFFYRFVCTTNDNGTFDVEGLKAGKYLIRGDGFENIEIDVFSGETTELTIRSPKLMYGRILRYDDQPPVFDQEPWPGAKVHVGFNSSEYDNSHFAIDNQGYFAVPVTDEEIEKLRRGELELNIFYPSSAGIIERENVYEIVGTFPPELLSPEKETAGTSNPPGSTTEVPIYMNTTSQPPSIINEPLPEIEDFGINLADSNNIMLVCFIDIDQRLSRNSIIQLARWAEELREKGLMIIAVQASKIEKTRLDDWIKENNIPFPVGMIEADPSTSLGMGEEQIRFNWGVKALPWLILTNAEHIVTAEGFLINELDSKIEQIYSR